MDRYNAGWLNRELARYVAETLPSGIRRDGSGRQRSLNNYGKVLKTELRRLLS
jgi:hypothetical protein